MDERMKWVKRIGETNAPSNSYSVRYPQDERDCACEMDGEWCVFYSERGQMSDLIKCTDEAHAYEILYYRLLNSYGNKVDA